MVINDSNGNFFIWAKSNTRRNSLADCILPIEGFFYQFLTCAGLFFDLKNKTVHKTKQNKNKKNLHASYEKKLEFIASIQLYLFKKNRKKGGGDRSQAEALKP